MVQEGAVAQRWDVFVSYAHENEEWVQVLAENLHRTGREVFFDRWEVVGGGLLSQRLQQGLAGSSVVVLVVSRAAVGKPWWEEEFAAAMAGAVAGVQRLIPVLLDDVPLPPFAAGRALAETIMLAVDDVPLPEYLARLDPTPLTRRLPLGAAVYRTRLDHTGVTWQGAPFQQPPENPNRDQQIIATYTLIIGMQRIGKPASEIGLTGDMLPQYQRHYNQRQQLPLVIRPAFGETLSTLLTLGLIAPTSFPDPDEEARHYLVYRWTTTALAKYRARCWRRVVVTYASRQNSDVPISRV